jgi:hypothetical protein
MIENIIGFGAKFKGIAFVHGEALEERQVLILEARSIGYSC